MKIIESLISDIPVFQVDTWKQLQHGFVGREVNLKSNDRNSIDAEWKKISAKKLYLLDQVHGVELVDLDQLQDYPAQIKSDGLIKADAWIGSINKLMQDNVALGIKTADCTPVLIIGEKHIAALHCGWRSAYGGLLEIALKTLKDKGEGIEKLQIAFGPAAQICCYEVNSELLMRFEAKNRKFSKNQIEISKNYEDKCFLSVTGYLFNEAINQGINIEHITRSKSCTICDKRFFSYRREKDDSGRQVSFIAPH